MTVFLPLVGLGESAHCAEGATSEVSMGRALALRGNTARRETHHSVCGKQTQ